MDGKRNELLPAMLFALATGAVGLSVLAFAYGGAGRRSVSLADRSASGERTPLRWPINHLGSLATPEPRGVAADGPLTYQPDRALTMSELAETNAIAVGPFEFAAPVTPQPTPPELATVDLDVPDLPATDSAAIALAAPQPMIPAVLQNRVAAPAPLAVLLPAPARRSAAASPPTEPGAWNVFGFDTVSIAERIGRQYGAASALSGRAFSDAKRWTSVQLEQQTDEQQAAAAPPTTTITRLAPPKLIPATPVRRTASPIAASVAERRPRYTIPRIERYLAAGTAGGVFPTPTQLGEQLARLTDSTDAIGWAWSVAYRLRGVIGSRPTDETAVRRSLIALRRAGDRAAQLADNAEDERSATELRRSRYALERRVATWSAVLSDPETLALDDRRKADWLVGQRWAMAPSGPGAAPRFLVGGPAETPAIRLARRLERYEAAPSGREARAIVEEAVRLAQADDGAGLELATAVQQHYRNANVRIAIAAGLIERFLPAAEPTTSTIRDRIAGAPVHGRSTTETRLSLATVPGNDAWRLALRAEGVVRSNTLSRGGPAILRSRASTNFTAEKRIVVNPRGFAAEPTRASAAASVTRLTGVSTRYDRLPVFGSYARSAARREYTQTRRRASAEVRTKVESRVSRELDARADEALARLDQRYRRDVLDRLAKLGLRVEPLEMRTTESRLISRVRVAGDRQLAAHTPRMRAPSDSLLSVQLHESTLNNLLESLDLAGQQMTLAELRGRLVEKFEIEPNGQIDADAQRTRIRFAAEDPIRVRFEQGEARLTMAIDEMSVRGKRHRGFKVHTIYHPTTAGLRAELVQTGPAQIEGRMRSSTRLRLHAAIGKMLGEDRRIPLAPALDRLRTDHSEKLEDLVTTQLVIEDGWLGIAVAPERPTDRVAIRVGSYVR